MYHLPCPKAFSEGEYTSIYATQSSRQVFLWVGKKQQHISADTVTKVQVAPDTVLTGKPRSQEYGTNTGTTKIRTFVSSNPSSFCLNAAVKLQWTAFSRDYFTHSIRFLFTFGASHSKFCIITVNFPYRVDVSGGLLVSLNFRRYYKKLC